MDADHMCNPKAFSFFCFHCLAGICSKCTTTIHQNHPLLTSVDFNVLLESHCFELSSAKNLKDLNQLKKDAVAIINTYISYCERNLHQIKHMIKESLTQGILSNELTTRFIATAPVQSTLKETLKRVTDNISQCVNNVKEEKIATFKRASINILIGKDTDIKPYTKKYYRDAYTDYLMDHGPLASFMKNLDKNNVTIWHEKGNRLTKMKSS